MKTESNELALAEREPMPVDRPAPTVGSMLQAVIDKGITADNAAAFTELVKLHEHMQDREAEKVFTAAFVALQSDLPQITARTVIPNRGKYEKFEDVMAVIGPLLQRHGFSVSFTNDFRDQRVIETCHLRHVGGHSQSNSFAVRVGRADSDTQADCKAATTAKRNAFLNALNIVIRQDCLTAEDNAAIEGGPITQEQADELARRVQLTNSDREKFLAFAGAANFVSIPSSKYAVLDEFLAKKERQGR